MIKWVLFIAIAFSSCTAKEKKAQSREINECVNEKTNEQSIIGCYKVKFGDTLKYGDWITIKGTDTIKIDSYINGDIVKSTEFGLGKRFLVNLFENGSYRNSIIKDSLLFKDRYIISVFDNSKLSGKEFFDSQCKYCHGNNSEKGDLSLIALKDSTQFYNYLIPLFDKFEFQYSKTDSSDYHKKIKYLNKNDINKLYQYLIDKEIVLP